jgi:hypothetical protein
VHAALDLLLRRAVGVVVGMMGFVMADVLCAGKRRGSEHHHQQGSGDDFLHGSTLAPK